MTENQIGIGLVLGAETRPRAKRNTVKRRCAYQSLLALLDLCIFCQMTIRHTYTMRTLGRESEPEVKHNRR